VTDGERGIDARTDPLAPTEAAPGPVGPIAQELPPGTRVGRYVVLKKLGAGGMGVVYAAHDEDLDRRVALKFLQEEMRGSYSSGAAVQRLQREAQVMAKLSHPNVVAVFDVGTFDGQVFLAMELVDGLSLRSWLEAKPRTAREIVSAYVQAGRGLEAAHAAGILHRDFKPENVIVDTTGRVRVLDFGVARIDDSLATHRDLSLTATKLASSPTLTPLTTEGEIVGTPAYMAPEQLQGKRADTRSDQFAFSVSLYEALYGERPHAGIILPELIANVVAGRVKPAPGGAKVSRGLRVLLLRGLRPHPDDRFASMGDLLAALEKQLHVRRSVLVGAVAIAAGAAALVVALRPTHPALCVGAEQEIAQSWGDKQRADVERALLASGSTRAKDVWGRVRLKLDDYAARWAAMRTESCQATRVRGVQSDEALDLRAACLDQRQRELSATATLLSTADATIVDRAVDMAGGLPEIAQCGDVAALRAPYAEPRDPANKKAVDEVRVELAEVATLLRARKGPDAEALAHKAASEARVLENLPLEARASFDIGMSLVARGKDEEARTSLVDSAIKAGTARDDVTEAEAWTMLIKTGGYDLGRFDEGELYAKLAGAAVDRLGSHEALRAQLLRRRADLLYVKGDLEKAQPIYREVLDLDLRALGDSSPETARAQVDLADLEVTRGRLRESLPLYESAVARVAAIEGEGSPALGMALIDYTETLVFLGEDDRAVANARRALAALPEGDVSHAQMRVLLACALVGRGDVADAKAEAAGGIAETDATSGSSSLRRAHAHAMWAGELLRRHLCDDALPEADKTIALLSTTNAGRSTLRTAQAARSICLTRAGHPNEGLALGATVLASEDKESPPSESGLVTALLAVGEAALGARDGPGHRGGRADALASGSRV
jgi:tetratricopeptide (TPR) repeat protein/predicted Ser/Thr protein kinase